MRVLLLTPMKKEYHCAREAFAAVELPLDGGFRFAEKQSGQNHIHILQCGFLLNDALNLYHDLYGIPDLIVDSGSCGALNNTFNQGEIYNVLKVFRNVSEFLYYDTPVLETEIRNTAIIQVSQAVNDTLLRSELARTADLCSMESYELCSIADLWQCPHYSFRVVTDSADSDMNTDFKRNIRESCLKLYRYLSTFLNDLSH